MKLTINVTQEDIDKGEQLDCFTCPIALAAFRVISGTPWMLVGAYSRYLRLFDSSITVWTHEIDIEWPDRVRLWVMGFDCGDEMQPISFEVDTDDGVTVGEEGV
jgi:hypothetical protein